MLFACSRRIAQGVEVIAEQVQDRSKPDVDVMACSSFARKVASSRYAGNFSKLTHVAELGRRVGSVSPARIAKSGSSSLKPSIGGRGHDVTKRTSARRSDGSNDDTTLQKACTSSSESPWVTVFRRRSSTSIFRA